MPRYNLSIYGNKNSSPFELKETVLRIFRLNEVTKYEIDRFRLHFDSVLTPHSKMRVIKEWVNIINTSEKLKND
jgi:hypothetical protein